MQEVIQDRRADCWRECLGAGGRGAGSREAGAGEGGVARGGAALWAGRGLRADWADHRL